MTTRKTWLAWLQVVLVLLFLYSLVLVFAGGVARSMFSAFGFGPSDAIDTDEVRDYLELPFMVLGAVMAGWTFMMLQIVRGPLRDGATWALPALTRSLVLWFVLDTGMSLVLGFPAHALFNIPFAIALAIPLARLRSTT
jgi:hypothetical protein